MDGAFDFSRRTLAVFGHPNHEIAVFGTLRRLKPSIIYLTDGGGQARVDQTRKALEEIGLVDRARFLNHTEESFYEALLRHDSEFFGKISEQLHTAIAGFEPEQILCDAIEYYNPVHDVTLPMVRTALRGLPDVPIFEVPLIYQTLEDGERYALQQVPDEIKDSKVAISLSDDELETKISVRDNVYTMLSAQMGPILTGPEAECSRGENVFRSRYPFAKPGVGRALRYEWRAEKLKERGEIGEVITYEGHFVPVIAIADGSLLRPYRKRVRTLAANVMSPR